MTNSIENYYAAKRAFKKKFGLFDKDVAIEELDEQVRMEEEAERMMIERDEQRERELESRWEEDYEEREMERRHEEAEIERQIEEQEQYRIEKRWEDFSIAEIEKEYKQNSEAQMPWSKAIRIIQTLVDEREDYGEGNKIIKQAWARILQG